MNQSLQQALRRICIPVNVYLITEQHFYTKFKNIYKSWELVVLQSINLTPGLTTGGDCTFGSSPRPALTRMTARAMFLREADHLKLMYTPSVMTGMFLSRKPISSMPAAQQRGKVSVCSVRLLLTHQLSKNNTCLFCFTTEQAGKILISFLDLKFSNVQALNVTT